MESSCKESFPDNYRYISIQLVILISIPSSLIIRNINLSTYQSFYLSIDIYLSPPLDIAGMDLTQQSSILVHYDTPSEGLYLKRLQQTNSLVSLLFVSSTSERLILENIEYFYSIR